jgi:hypothetical protein
MYLRVGFLVARRVPTLFCRFINVVPMNCLASSLTQVLHTIREEMLKAPIKAFTTTILNQTDLYKLISLAAMKKCALLRQTVRLQFPGSKYDIQTYLFKIQFLELIHRQTSECVQYLTEIAIVG